MAVATMLSHNALKRHAGGKTGKFFCCKCVFDRIKGNLAQIQPKNHQNVQKTHFLPKVPGVNGLTRLHYTCNVKIIVGSVSVLLIS